MAVLQAHPLSFRVFASWALNLVTQLQDLLKWSGKQPTIFNNNLSSDGSGISGSS